MKFSICAETVFTDISFEDRLPKIKELGFDGIEFWASGDKNIDSLAKTTSELGFSIGVFSGQRAGTTFRPEDRESYIAEVKGNIEKAKKLNCKTLMLLTDPLESDGSVKETYPEIPFDKKVDETVETLKQLAAIAEENDINLVLEPLNTKVDHPGCFLSSSAVGFEIIERVNHPRMKLLYDIYHMTMMEDDAAAVIAEKVDQIGHIHIADAPGRHEPGTGNIDYPRLLNLLKEKNYSGFIGFEFFPKGDSTEALNAIKKLQDAL